MVSLVKKNAAFFIPYFIFLLCGGIVLVFKSKIGIYFFINKYHFSVADLFFKYWTNLGLGWLIIPVIIILAFVQLRYVIMAIACFLLCFSVNDLIKFLAGTPRPAEVLSGFHQSFYAVPGVELYHWNSFPSGHTAIAFCLFALLALISSRNYMKFILFVIGFLVGYSRMYLSEHFLIDVYVGSLIGVLSTLCVYALGMKASWLNNPQVMTRPLIPYKK